MTYTQVWDHMSGAPSETVIQRDADGAFIPNDPANRDYQEYQEWLAEGNTPKPPVGQPIPPIGTTPPPDIIELNEQVQDIDARLAALEQEVSRGR